MDEPYNPFNSQTEFQDYMKSRVSEQVNEVKKINTAKELDIILPQIKDLIELSKKTFNAELEIHIGEIINESTQERRHKRQQSRFHSGVSRESFERQLEKLDKFQGWVYKSETWEQIEEFIFDGDIRMRRNAPNGNGIFMKKNLIKGMDIHLKECQYDIRLVLKSEQQTSFTFGIPVFYRFKERKIYTHGNFTYFFTKVWDGKTIDQVRTKICKYEIELECITFDTDTDSLATSMMMKCGGIIGYEKKIKKEDGVVVDTKFMKGVQELYDKIVKPTVLIQQQHYDKKLRTDYQQFVPIVDQSYISTPYIKNKQEEKISDNNNSKTPVYNGSVRPGVTRNLLASFAQFQ